MRRACGVCTIGVSTALSLMVTLGHAKEVNDAADMAKRIEAAWKYRETAIKSLHLEATAKVTKMVTDTKPNDPFDTPIDPNGKWRPVVVEKEITYSFDGQKRAASFTGDEWHPQLRAPKFQAIRTVFDGREYASLLETGDFRLGEIGKSGVRRNILVGYWLQPMRLFLEPGATLESRSFSLEHAQTQFYDTKYEGTDCVEAKMALVRDGRILPRVGVAYLDPKFDFRFVAFFVEQSDGAPTMKYTAKYVPDARVKWLISEWTIESFREGGKADTRYDVRVKRALVNEPVDEKLFKLAFPIGTEIDQKERGETKRYIQERGDHRRPLSEKDLEEQRKIGAPAARDAA